MAEERITETTDAEGNTHTRTTIVTDEPRRSGASWGLLLILAVAVVAGIVIFTQMGGAEVAKDASIAEAANSVGDAAEQVGDAAQDVADEVTD